MRSGSLAGVAPYGDHLVLVPKYRFFGQYYTSPVFAGYCGLTLDYRWIDSHKLEMICTAEKVKKKAVTSNGIEIKYNITEETAHNTRLDPTGDKPGAVLH